MAVFTNQVETSASQQTVWDYVIDIDRWAPLFPGYQRHLTVAEDQFEWHIRGDAGAWSRLVQFHVEVIEWSPPGLASFRIKGLTEPLVGSGKFVIEPSEQGSTMAFEIDAAAEGPTAPMINVLLNTFLSEHSGGFLEELKREIESSTGPKGDGQSTVDVPASRGVATLVLTTRRTVEASRWVTDVVVPAATGLTTTRSTKRLEALPDPTDRGRLDTILQVATTDMAATMATLAHLLDAGEESLLEDFRWEFAREVSTYRRGLLAKLFRR